MFPNRTTRYARSDDPRLRSTFAMSNQCCGSLKNMSGAMKNAFYVCVEGYNELYGKDLDEEKKMWANELFIAVRFLGSTNSVEKKQDFLNKKTELLCDILNKLGIN